MKKAHKYGLLIMAIGLTFLVVETIVFLFIEGWHYKAISEAEMFCDLLARFVMSVGVFLWFMSAAWIVNTIYKEEII